MNNFCRHLRLSLSQRFNIDVDVYVSKKRKLVHMSDCMFLSCHVRVFRVPLQSLGYMSLVKLLLFYRSFKEIIEFVKNYWQKIKFFFPEILSFTRN